MKSMKSVVQLSSSAARLQLASSSSSSGWSRRTLASFRSPLQDVDFPKTVSYPAHMLSRCDEFGGRTAIVCANTGRTISYHDLKSGTSRVASGLSRLGFGRGDVMCMYCHNFPEYPTAMYGIMSTGGILTTANPEYTVEKYCSPAAASFAACH